MDNRRFSARADVGGARYGGRRRDMENVSDLGATPLLDKAVELTRLNWELIIFVGLLILTALTRLGDLGPRALHHDESIHAYYSNWFLRSGDYTTTDPTRFQGGYDPTYHGPFLYHITALGYLLFGVTDATSRLMPALFGIILIGLCWLLRPFIGRIGAILAAVFILLSPIITYYSRSLRHDIFALTGTLLLFVALLWFMRTHQSKWVYLGALGLVVAYASHELTYIIAFMFVLFLALAALLYRAFAGRNDYDAPPRAGADVNPVISAAKSLLTQRWTLIGAALLFLAIYTVLFTSMLTKPQLITSGVVEGLRYWLNEHQGGVGRGAQPVYYYLLLMLIYEPLAFFTGLGTIVYMFIKWIVGRGDEQKPSNDVDVPETGAHDRYGHPLPLIEGLRGLTFAFLAFWSFGSLIAFSLAGERMPWLNMQPALPFTLLAAAGLGKLFAGVEWRQVWRGGGAFLGVVVVLFIFAAFATVAFLTGQMPDPTGQSAELQSFLRLVLLFAFTGGLLGLAGWLAWKLQPMRALKVLALTFVIILAGYGLRSMMLLNFRHGDVPIEMAVYTQSAPDVPIVAAMIERLSRDETAFDAGRNANDVTGGHSLTIAIDTNESITWPFNWYLRDMRDVKYFDKAAWEGNQANVIAPNTPVILASDATEALPAFKAFIEGKYTSQRYVLNWWFPEEAYKKGSEGDLGVAMNWLFNNGGKYLLYRDPGIPLGSRNFYLHIRNDLAVKTGVGASMSAMAPVNPSGGGGPSEGGRVYKMLDLAPAPLPGAPAERGQFNLPRTIATAPDGSFYVVDTGNMRVQKFNADGTFASIFGARGEGDGQFKSFSDEATGTGPSGIAVDKVGNIYIADTWNHRIQKFDPTGKFLLKWGEFINLADPGAANDAARDSKFFGPRGIAVGPTDGNIYVTDTGNKRVLIFDANGKYLRQIASNMTPEKVTAQYAFNQPGEMNEPIGVAVDAGGSVYVADTNNKRIQKFDGQGKFVAQWAIPGNGWDAGPYLEPFITLDSAGNLYVAAPTGQKVLKYSSAGQALGEKSAQGAISLKTPTGVTVGADGNIYVVDVGSNGVVNLGAIP